MYFVFLSVLTLTCYTCENDNDQTCKIETDCPTTAQYCKTFKKGMWDLFLYDWICASACMETATEVQSDWSSLHLFLCRRCTLSNVRGILRWGLLHNLLPGELVLPLRRRSSCNNPIQSVKLMELIWMWSKMICFHVTKLSLIFLSLISAHSNWESLKPHSSSFMNIATCQFCFFHAGSRATTYVLNPFLMTLSRSQPSAMWVAFYHYCNVKLTHHFSTH